MLQAKNIYFSYLDEKKPAINNADVALTKGTINQIGGENGAGKTTIALVLSGIIPYLIKGTFSGKVTWEGHPVLKEILSKQFSFVFQDPYPYFAGYTVNEEKQLFGIFPANLLQIYNELFPNVSLDMPLHKLSSGEQQRIAIVSALSRPNPIIILDEPFEFLDKKARNDAAQLFMEKAKSGSLIIVIERPRRNMNVINYNAKFEVRDGKILPKTNEILFEFPNIIRNHSTGSLNLKAEGLIFSYPDRPEFMLNNLNMSINRGESVGLIGPNGCGKTTLLFLLSGLITPYKGVISIANKTKDIKALRQVVKCSFQNANAQIFGKTVREELQVGLINAKLGKQAIEEKIVYAKKYLPFDLNADPLSLSYGQKKILGLTATFLMEPEVILLDEPTAALDTKNLFKLYELIDNYLEAGGSILISTHDEDRIKKICNRIIEMENGQIIDEHLNDLK